jgi:hypothetical protein
MFDDLHKYDGEVGSCTSGGGFEEVETIVEVEDVDVIDTGEGTESVP